MKILVIAFITITLFSNTCSGQFTFERNFTFWSEDTYGMGGVLSSNGYATAGFINPGPMFTKSAFFQEMDLNGNPIYFSGYNLNFDSWIEFMHKCIGDTFIIAGELQNVATIQYDMNLIKTDHFGNLIWRKTYSSDTLSSDIIPRSICNTVDNGYLVLCNQSSSGIRYFKIDANGDSLFAKNIGYPFSGASSMIEMSTGGFAILGSRYNGSNGPTTILRLNAAGDTIRSFDFTLDSAGSVSEFIETKDHGFALVGALLDTAGNYPLAIWKFDSLGHITLEK
jgi:hypothetical protein